MNITPSQAIRLLEELKEEAEKLFNSEKSVCLDSLQDEVGLITGLMSEGEFGEARNKLGDVISFIRINL